MNAAADIDPASAASHVMQPPNTRGVVSSRGLEEGTTKFAPRARPAGVTLSFNTDGFVAALNTALANSTAGYVMQLRQHGQPIASAQVGWAKEPSDGSESWVQSCPHAHRELQQVDHRHRHDAHARRAQPAGLDEDHRLPADLLGQGSEHRQDHLRRADDAYSPASASAGPTCLPDHEGADRRRRHDRQSRRVLVPEHELQHLPHPAPGDERHDPGEHHIPSATEDQIWDYATVTAYAAYVAQYLFQPAGVSGPTLTHPDPDALAYAFPAGAGWNSGDLTTDSGGAGWHMSVDDLLDVMGCFRRQGTIMSSAAAQTMLDDSFGIDLIESTSLGTLYNKNGLWQSGAGQTEQSLAYFLPRDMELVVLANSPIGNPGQFFRDVVTNIYLDNIAPGDPGRRLDRPSRPHRRAIPGGVQRLCRQPRYAVDGRQRLRRRTDRCTLHSGSRPPPRPPGRRATA